MKDISYTIQVDLRVPNHYNPDYIPNLIRSNLEKTVPKRKPTVRVEHVRIS